MGSVDSEYREAGQPQTIARAQALVIGFGRGIESLKGRETSADVNCSNKYAYDQRKLVGTNKGERNVT